MNENIYIFLKLSQALKYGRREESFVIKANPDLSGGITTVFLSLAR